MATHYTVKAGTRVKVTCTVRTAAGVATNSSTQAARVFLPDGTELSPAPTIVDEAGDGIYSFEFATQQHGRYEVEFQTTSPDTAENITVTVPKTPFSTAP